MINNVSSQLSLRSYQASPIAGRIDHLALAREYKEAFDKPTRNQEDLQNARGFFEKAIDSTKAELARDFSNQEKEDLLITIYSEYASFLMSYKSDLDGLTGEFLGNLSTIEELYDAALKIAETKQKRNPENLQEKKKLIALYCNYLEVLNYFKHEDVLIYNYRKQTKDTTPAFNKINHFLTSILENKREDKELKLAVAQALSKPVRTLSFEVSLALISILISKKDMDIRLAAAEALRGCPSFHAGYKLPDGNLLYSVFLPLITFFANTYEDKKIRSAAGKILNRQDKILKNVPDEVISKEMRLGLLSILLDQNEEHELRSLASELFGKNPNLSRIVPLSVDSYLALSDLFYRTGGTDLRYGAAQVMLNSMEPQVKTGASQE